MRSANVLGTFAAMELCTVGKPKRFVFISSTSVLDSEHYVRLSDMLLAKGGSGILESDDLQGSRNGLPTGYGQTKWVSEQLVMEAGRRGLQGAIIRPGYIVGDSVTGGAAQILPITNNYSGEHGRLYYQTYQGMYATRAHPRNIQHCQYGSCRSCSENCDGFGLSLPSR